MGWGKALLLFFRNALVTFATAALVMGLIGYWVAGVEGFRNGAVWGLALGMFTLPVLMYSLISAYFWGGYANRAGGWWFRRQYGEEEPRNR